MFKGQYVFSQITDHLPLHTFRRCVERYHGEWYVKQFRCFDQYLAMSFAQLTHRESLRDIEACLKAQSSKLYHMGLRSSISRSTLADANEQRDWRIYADFAQALIKIARPLYAGDELGLDLKKLFTLLTHLRLNFVFLFFHGHSFDQQSLPLNCIHYLT